MIIDALYKGPAISVLMPVYNAEMYVGEAIGSILNQTHQNFEFLIFNDGSTDRSAEVIESIRDARIRFFNYEQNSGYVKHLNYGIQLAEGKYIARMDADDISHPERFAKQISFMEANPEVGVCGTWYDLTGDSSYIVKVASGHDELIINLLLNSVFGHPSVMMRTKVLHQHGMLYDEGYMPAEDYKMWVEFSRVSHLANLCEVLLHYRLHEGQISNYKRKAQLDKIRAVKELQVEYLLENKLTEEERRMVNFFFGNPDPVYEAHFFNKAVEWANKLIRVNSYKKFYLPDTFKMFMLSRVNGLMYKTIYNRSLLFNKGKKLLLHNLSGKDKIKFYIKCLLNWQSG